jgi:hypothetical protein
MSLVIIRHQVHHEWLIAGGFRANAFNFLRVESCMHFF